MSMLIYIFVFQMDTSQVLVSWLIFQIVVYLTNINPKKAHIKPPVNKANINQCKMNLSHLKQNVTKHKSFTSRRELRQNLFQFLYVQLQYFIYLSYRANRFKPCRNLKENIRNATHKPRTSAASANTRHYSRPN